MKHNADYFGRNPWMRSYSAAKYRCADPDNVKYNGHGIRFTLTREQIKFLWIADGASSMKKPSIDRIKPYGDYEFLNCQFIEHNENSGMRRNARTAQEQRKNI